MTTVHYDARCTDDERRAALYRGDIFVYQPLPAAQRLAELARGMVEAAFAPHDPTNSRNSHFVFVIGRLGDKQSLASATADMNRIMKGIADLHPDTDGTGARVSTMKEVVLGDVTTML